MPNHHYDCKMKIQYRLHLVLNFYEESLGTSIRKKNRVCCDLSWGWNGCIKLFGTDGVHPSGWDHMTNHTLLYQYKLYSWIGLYHRSYNFISAYPLQFKYISCLLEFVWIGRFGCVYKTMQDILKNRITLSFNICVVSSPIPFYVRVTRKHFASSIFLHIFIPNSTLEIISIVCMKVFCKLETKDYKTWQAILISSFRTISLMLKQKKDIV